MKNGFEYLVVIVLVFALAALYFDKPDSSSIGKDQIEQSLPIGSMHSIPRNFIVDRVTSNTADTNWVVIEADAKVEVLSHDFKNGISKVLYLNPDRRAWVYRLMSLHESVRAMHKAWREVVSRESYNNLEAVSMVTSETETVPVVDSLAVIWRPFDVAKKEHGQIGFNKWDWLVCGKEKNTASLQWYAQVCPDSAIVLIPTEELYYYSSLLEREKQFLY